MVFNSLTFVVFFACVLALHSLPLPWTTKKINLLIASYLFYAAWNPPFVILLWISTVVDWYAAQGLVKARRQAARHAWMLLSVIANLGMLGYFKYGQFLLDNFTAFMGALGVPYHPAHYDIVLPVGISFYTFATMSYTLDVYLRPTRSMCTCGARRPRRTCSTTRCSSLSFRTWWPVRSCARRSSCRSSRSRGARVPSSCASGWR
jgi:alginate O-acetyltransferase complex protein AlgI